MSEQSTMQKAVWALDVTHSEITFKVKHMMVTNVTGKFEDYSVTADIDEENFENSQVSFLLRRPQASTPAWQTATTTCAVQTSSTVRITRK